MTVRCPPRSRSADPSEPPSPPGDGGTAEGGNWLWDNRLVLFGEVAALLNGSFAPVEEKGRDAISFYSAVCKRFGIEANDSILSARNHSEVREGVRWFYARLSDLLGERSDTWAMRPMRTEDEVLEVLARAAKQFPSTDYDNVKAVLRIGINKVSGRGKPRGSIAVEAVRVAHLQGQSFAQTISEALSPGSSDLEALSRLEAVMGDCDPKTVDWKPAAQWSLAYSAFTGSDPPDVSLAAYCAWISDDWSMSDGDLLQRLERVRAVVKPAVT